MKLIVKVEIVLLVLVLVAAVGMILYSEGVFDLLWEPQIQTWETMPVPTEAAAEILPEESEPIRSQAVQSQQENTPGREVSAKKYFAYDIRRDTYVAMKGQGDEKLYPASITKLLTAYVVLQYMDPEEIVTVGNAMELVQPDSSVAGLQVGDQLTVEQLIAGMMLPSGNDAAQVVAVATGRKLAESNISYTEAVGLFVEEMNRQAERLGMVNSHFANPDGFHHDNHYTTMDDLVVLCKAVMADPVILRYTSSTAESVDVGGRTLEWENTNLLMDSQEVVYQPNAMGMKTGYTDMAGNCLMSAFFREDRIILIGVFGTPAFTEDRYLDTIAIYNSL